MFIYLYSACEALQLQSSPHYCNHCVHWIPIMLITKSNHDDIIICCQWPLCNGSGQPSHWRHIKGQLRSNKFPPLTRWLCLMFSDQCVCLQSLVCCGRLQTANCFLCFLRNCTGNYWKKKENFYDLHYSYYLLFKHSCIDLVLIHVYMYAACSAYGVYLIQSLLLYTVL